MHTTNSSIFNVFQKKLRQTHFQNPKSSYNDQRFHQPQTMYTTNSSIFNVFQKKTKNYPLLESKKSSKKMNKDFNKNRTVLRTTWMIPSTGPSLRRVRQSQIKTNKSTQNPKNLTFLSSFCSPPLSSLESPLFTLSSASLWFSALRLSQVSTAHLNVSGIRYKIINIWAILFVKNLKITLFIWALPGLGVKFGPSIFFLVINRICFVFFLFCPWVSHINKSCVNVMAGLNFILIYAG